MSLAEKLAGVALATAAAAPSLFQNDLSMPILGVPITTIGAAVLGTYAAIGYDDTVIPRGRLFALAASNVIVSSALVAVLPGFFDVTWNSDGVEGGAAAVVSFAAYYLLRPAMKRLVELIKAFRFGDIVPWLKKGRDTAVTPADPRITPPAPGPGEPSEGDK